MLVCARCDSGTIVKDYDYLERRAYDKCGKCGCEQFKDTEKEYLYAQDYFDKSLTHVIEIPKQEVTPVAELTAKRACKNHPEKWAFKEGLCSECHTKKHGMTHKELQKRKKAAAETAVNPVTEIDTVVLASLDTLKAKYLLALADTQAKLDIIDMIIRDLAA